MRLKLPSFLDLRHQVTMGWWQRFSPSLCSSVPLCYFGSFGSGACAALVAGHRRGLSDRRAFVELDGGTLDIVWREDGHVIMTGPAAVSFEGAFEADLLAAS